MRLRLQKMLAAAAQAVAINYLCVFNPQDICFAGFLFLRIG